MILDFTDVGSSRDEEEITAFGQGPSGV